MPSGEASLAAHLGHNLRLARRCARLTQRELASRAGVHRSALAALERGERVPRIETALRLAGALEMPLARLLAGIAWVPDGRGSGAFLLASRVERHRETMRQAAALRASQAEAVDVAELIREEREELERRGEGDV